jgi:hypothetical protein
MNKLGLISALLVLAIAPCARAESVCLGGAAAAGATVHGPVLDIADGSSLCVATSPDLTTWVKIKVPQLKATRGELMAAAFGKNATCVVGRNGEGSCVVEGAALAQTLQRPEIVKAATDWH